MPKIFASRSGEAKSKDGPSQLDQEALFSLLTNKVDILGDAVRSTDDEGNPKIILKAQIHSGSNDCHPIPFELSKTIVDNHGDSYLRLEFGKSENLPSFAFTFSPAPAADMSVSFFMVTDDSVEFNHSYESAPIEIKIGNILSRQDASDENTLRGAMKKILLLPVKQE